MITTSVRAAVALALLSTATATAAGPVVEVRVEGSTQTVVPPISVRADTVTAEDEMGVDRTVEGRTAFGATVNAVDVGRGTRFSFGWSDQLGPFVTRFGQDTSVPFKGKFWQLWIDTARTPGVGYVVAQTGARDTLLMPGDRVLWQWGKGSETVLDVILPEGHTSGPTFVVRVVTTKANGKRSNAGGAIVEFSGKAYRADTRGRVRLPKRGSQRVPLAARRRGDVRFGQGVFALQVCGDVVCRRQLAPGA